MSSRSESAEDATGGERSKRRLRGRGRRAEGPEVAVAEPSREEVLRTVFGIGSHDVRTYDAVVAVPGSTTRELADNLDRDRSNVNRSLNRLREAGLVTRDRRLLDEGGHVYQYSAAEGTADDLVARAVDRWRSAALDAIGSE
jgi:predicted transcriptional regulator